MKNNTNQVILLIASLMTITSSFSQTKYFTGFDNNTEKMGWTEFNKGKKTFKNWQYQANGAGSSANKLINTAPTGDADKDSLVDWFVSPKFDFSKGGNIDSIKYNYFSFMNTFIKEQYVGIFLLVGSNDPEKASSKVLLADLTKNYSGDNTWKDTGNFLIPSINGNCYIAFKFKAVDGWSSISFDNINITLNKTNSLSSVQKLASYSIYPNPAKSHISIKTEGNYAQLYNTSIKIYSLSSQLILDRKISLSQPVELNLNNGIYCYQLYNGSKKMGSAKKLIVQN